jgi:hypothetical protein
MSSLGSVLALSTVAAAQEYDPNPAKQLVELKALVGDWAGSGKMVEPTGQQTSWTAQMSYRWTLGGHFLQEDFAVRMQGLDVPMVMRNYYGWDRERGRFVAAMINSNGRARLNEVRILSDGTLTTLQRHHEHGIAFQERSSLRVVGDRMVMSVDMLMPEGDSVQVIKGALERGAERFEGDWSVAAWMGAEPNESMQKLARMAGSYLTTGEMVTAPGMPTTAITGTDKWEMVFGGVAMHGRTDGQADGAPNAYESHALWGWDPREQCMTTVFVDSMGQVGQMQCRWYDGKLISTMAGTQGGMPTTQRYIIYVDEQGRAQRCKGHVTFGATDPFQSFRAAYERK